MVYKVLILSTIVLLPIVPAFLLFKLLRSRASVTGPLAGFTVNFGGPFGGYIGLFLILITNFGSDLLKPAYRTWQVEGTVEFAGAPPPDVTCSLAPPQLPINFNTFRFSIPMMDDAPPDLVFQAPGYRPQVVSLSNKPAAGRTIYQKDSSIIDSKITFKQPVILQALPSAPYAATEQATPTASTGG